VESFKIWLATKVATNQTANLH